MVRFRTSSRRLDDQTSSEPSVTATLPTMDGLAAGLTDARATLESLMWEIDFLHDEAFWQRQRGRAYLFAFLIGGAAGGALAAVLSIAIQAGGL